MDEENIRTPDSVFREQLVYDYDENMNEYEDFNQNIPDYDLENALAESRKDYEKQMEIEQIKNHKINLFKKLDIQLNYLTLDGSEYNKFFVECFNIEKDRFIENKNNICLFYSHFKYMIELLHELYTKPLNRNKNPKIDKELFDLLIENLKFN